MASRQCMLAMELKDIEREKVDGSQAKHQIRQYFPPPKIAVHSIYCMIKSLGGLMLKTYLGLVD